MPRLQFPRVFSTPNIHPYDQITWVKTEARITDDTGATIFVQKDVAVPAQWSPLAAKIAVSKYFYGDAARGTDPRTGGRETSVRQLIDRVAKTITTWGIRGGYFETSGDADRFDSELTWLLVNQYGAFNSPVWFNLGLFQAYSIGTNAGLGNWVYDAATGEARRASSQYEWPQISACFILSVKDNMESIMDLAKAEAMLFKYGSGAGTDLSALRSTREKLSGGGRPSGPLSFLRIYDAVAGTVKSAEVVC